MKVCFVAYYAKSLAGAEKSLLSLMKRMMEKDIQLVLVCDRTCQLTSEAEKLGIKTKIIPVKPYVYPRNLINSRTYLAYVAKRMLNKIYHKEMYSFLKTENVDLMHINSTLTCYEWAAVADKHNIPYVWHLREFLGLDHNNEIIGKKYFISLIQKAKNVIAISEAIKNYWSPIIQRRIEVVYNGLEIENYYQQNDHSFDRENIQCIITGRVVEGKGQMDAVKAISHLRDKGITNVRLTIVGYRGESEYELKIKYYIADNHLEEYVKLVDFTSDVKPLLKKSDIGLVCSKAEAFGRITIEYMLSGLFVIGSNSGGTPELIKEGINGVLYSSGDVSNLADRIEWVLRNIGEAKLIAKRGQIIAAEKFSMERTSNKVLDIYKNI